MASVLHHCRLGDTDGIKLEKKLGCWYVDAGDVITDLHILRVQVVNITACIISYRNNLLTTEKVPQRSLSSQSFGKY